MASAEQVVTAAKSVGRAKHALLRRHIRRDGWGDMSDDLARAIETMGGEMTVEEAGHLQVGVDAAFVAKANVVAQRMIQEGYEAATMLSGTVIDALVALLKEILPMLVKCIPV